MRLVFMGTPGFSTPTLKALAAAGHDIAAVYTQPPRPAGRGKRPRPSPVQSAAEDLGLEVRTPQNFKDAAERQAFAGLGADAAVVVAYGLILPQAILDAPTFGCFNIHASLLPRWRGAAPIQRAIMAGDVETGVCIMQMTLGLDEGPVLARAATPIGADDTSGTLHDRLAQIGGPLMVETLEKVAAGAATAVPQSEDGVVYAEKIEKTEARIDWSWPATAVDAHIRGLSPFPGAWFETESDRGLERVKALLSTLPPPGVAPITAAPGTVIDDVLTVACGGEPRAAVRLQTVQRAGKGPMPTEVLLNGFPIPVGRVLA